MPSHYEQLLRLSQTMPKVCKRLARAAHQEIAHRRRSIASHVMATQALIYLDQVKVSGAISVDATEAGKQSSYDYRSTCDNNVAIHRYTKLRLVLIIQGLTGHLMDGQRQTGYTKVLFSSRRKLQASYAVSPMTTTISGAKCRLLPGPW